jgi:hypothetical protein
MRNKKLHHLTEQARKASDELTTYLTHLDARETDASYVHARMLFDEGWRLRDHGHRTPEDERGHRIVLWLDGGDEDESPASHAADDLHDHELHQALQLSPSESSTGVLRFLIELTDEVGVYVPAKVAARLGKAG